MSDNINKTHTEGASDNHHHSGRHNSSHRSSRHSSSKKRKFNRFVRKNKKNIIKSAIAIAVLVALIIVASLFDAQTVNEDKLSANSNYLQQTKNSIKIQVPLYTDDILIVNPAVTDYLNTDVSTDANEFFKKYYTENVSRLDVGLPVNLSYAVTGISDGYNIGDVELLVSENDDFSNSKVYHIKGDNNSVDVYNLKTNTTYYYRFNFKISNGSVTSSEGSFKTQQSPRILSVDGVYNLRDIGGWTTTNGKTIKQGLLYRGSELDGAVEEKYTITSDGANIMLGELGIKTEMDLRSADDSKGIINPLGKNINRNIYNVPMYLDVFETNGKAAIKSVFSDLANKNNYPVYLHCTHGLDRTGVVCYLLGAVLGMNKDDLIREYQLSSLCHGELWAVDQLHDFINQLNAYEGKTLQEKAQNYLLSTGVTKQEIDNIQDIFID